MNVLRKLIRKIVSENENSLENHVDDTIDETLWNVFESKYYYSTYKEILFTGTFEQCKKVIKSNPEYNLEMLPVNKGHGHNLDIQEGIRLKPNAKSKYNLDFNNDKENDIISLKYNKDLVGKKISEGVSMFFSYRINHNVDKEQRINLLGSIKKKLIANNTYEQLLNKAIIGLFNNPNFDMNDVDLIVYPESNSSINADIALKIKNKLSNALLISNAILKNEAEKIEINYDALNQSTFTNKENMKSEIERMIQKATTNGQFQIKKVYPSFRKYILNFLKLDEKNRTLMNKIMNGKVIVVDDYIIAGSTLKETNKIINAYAPKEVILYSLIA